MCDNVSNTNEFSSTNWLRATNLYVDKIKNDLMDDNWGVIFNTLDRLKETRTQEAQVNAGAVSEVSGILSKFRSFLPISLNLMIC